MDRLKAFVESRRLERVIMALIIVNAITLGLETSPWAMQNFGELLYLVDRAILGVFVVEIALRLIVHRLSFFKSAWNIFDFLVVAVALAPATATFSVLRALRVLRVLRMITIVPSLKRVVGALVSALPGMGSIVLLLGLLFYVYSVMATKLFAASFPEWFGHIPASAYTLFQVMTLESWSMGIVRPVMDVYPYAWLFFIPFILSTTFTMLNLFIGIVVNAMQSEHDEVIEEELAAKEKVVEEEKAEEQAARIAAQESRDMLADEIRQLRQEIADLRQDVRAGKSLA
ncbi:MAG TPA: ion transporter [Saliniramus sp.]|nr:ion transporter [Saliniramus sp.]